MPIKWAARYIILVLTVSIATCISIRGSQPYLPSKYKGVVRGVNTTDKNGNVYVRREIRDLKANYPDQWTLYLLALEKLQWSDQSDPYSYYGLANIHGKPYKVWEDAPGLPYKLGTAAYCPHGNELFLGWHRPYIALFEQVLHDLMREIALGAPWKDIQRYTAAADAFRLPYWDWGLGGADGVVPDFLMSKTILIVELNGQETVMRNPLYSYRFHPLVPNDFSEKWSEIEETVRWPTSNDATAPSQQDKFAGMFTVQSASLTGAVEMAFRTSTFSHWSKQLEDPHGWMHGIIGGGWDETQNGTKFGGHMWPLEYSAYEPLFMLHHTNVDRLWAMFQAVKPHATMQQSIITSAGNVYLEEGQAIDGNTALLPFRHPSGPFWTTNACHDTALLGYAYPETQHWHFASPALFQANVTATITRLYSGKTRSLLLAAQQRTGPVAAGPHIPALLGQDNSFTDWTIESQAHADCLPSTFVVRFLLAGVDVGTWMRLMPARYNDGSGASSSSSSPSSSSPLLHGSTGLTTHLIDAVMAGQLASLAADHVVPFLTQRLVWSVAYSNGTHIPDSALSSLSIQVASANARIPDDPGALVEYAEEKTLWPGVTRGRVGGGLV